MAAAEILEAIAAQVRVCTKCPLYLGTKNGVPGEGSPEAEVMLIGDGPGYHDDRQGRPFVGPAGAFLNRLLGRIGLDPASQFISNVGRQAAPHNAAPPPTETHHR